MSLKYILLGFLNIHCMTGYKLKQLLDYSINNFWSVNLSQIYPTLNAMKKDEFLDVDIQVNEGTPNSKIYYITEKGKIALDKWMKETTPLPHTRNLFLAKLMIGTHFSKDLVITQLKEQLSLHEKALESLKKRFETEPICMCNMENIEKHKLFRRLIIDAGIKEEKASIEWCKETIEVLKESKF